MDSNENVNLNNLFYGCLYHFMGYNAIALRHLSKCKDDNEWKDIAVPLSRYIGGESQYNSAKTIQQRVNSAPVYLGELLAIHTVSGEIINAKGYFDEKTYSRQFYKYKAGHFTNDQISKNIIPAIFLYILRSHCSSWASNATDDNRITDSKEALNDLVQAESLLHILSFDLHVERKPGKELLYSFDNQTLVLAGQPNLANYSLLLFTLKYLINIFKGNIYKNINFVENALDSYCNALRLYEEQVKIEESLKNNGKLGRLLCPTIGKCYFEVSKLLFDRGKIIDALVYQLKSIIHLLSLAYAQNNKKTAVEERIFDEFKNLFQAKAILDKTRRIARDHVRRDLVMSVFVNREKLTEMYRHINNIKKNKANTPIFLGGSGPLVSPGALEKFVDMIQGQLKPVILSTIADILARIGFVLYTIREVIQFEKCPEEFQKQENGEALVEEWNKTILEEVKGYFLGFDGYESELGNYTRAFLYPDDKSNLDVDGKPKEFFSRRIERLFSYSFRGVAVEKEKGIRGFINKLAKHSLITAGSLSSIPIRMSHYLVQEGYGKRTSDEKKFRRGLLNKFVVLRRWQSFNPKVPRPRGQDIRGGGYFLFWKGKGIVIDPGYNFIQNFYEEGFSLEDINAIVVTHSHPDHDDELNTILTLIAEWNQMQEMHIGHKPKYIDLDLFLNEGAYRKYDSWVYAKNIKVKKIYFLQAFRWDRRTEVSRKDEKIGGTNPIIDLKHTYGFKLEVIPAWHDEIIDEHSSVGLLFHLYQNETGLAPQLKIGITGDTQYYGGIVENYQKADILVAHLGDIKFREVLPHVNNTDKALEGFVKQWFARKDLFEDNLLDVFKNYLMHQDIFGLDEAFLRPFINPLKRDEQLNLLTNLKAKNELQIKNIVDTINAYSIPNEHYTYKNHLGLKGLFNLYEAMASYPPADHQPPTPKLLIVGELPEELQSYRHLVACLLNEHSANAAKSLTGDIGLTIGLPTEKIKFGYPSDQHPLIAIRCMKCNQNNEYIKGIPGKVKNTYYLPHYHPLESIQEIPLKACNSRIGWFCLNHHASPPDYAKHEYVIEPDLRSVW
jgi:hypothetical protein